MNQVTTLAAVTAVSLIGSHLGAWADPSESENQAYRYGVHLGWAGAECNAFEQGKIPRSWLMTTFTRIGTDRQLNDTFKAAIYKTIENNRDFVRCAKALGEWKNGSYE